MERRRFLKTLLASPFLTPRLRASSSHKNDLNLYVIGGDPQLLLPSLLDELQFYTSSFGHNFTFINAYPEVSSLRKVLSQKGWMYVEGLSHAHLTISFRPLRHRFLPSFTLVKNGRIWDIRSRKLYSSWEELNNNPAPSSLMTTVSFMEGRPLAFSGEHVSVYKDGRQIERISLQEKGSESFKAGGGKITIRLKEGKTWISESSCRHKICLYTPPVALAGERIICAPNHFLLEIQSSSSIDTVIG